MKRQVIQRNAVNLTLFLLIEITVFHTHPAKAQFGEPTQGMKATAQSETPPMQTNEVQTTTIETETIDGTLLRMQQNTLIVQFEDETEEIMVTDDMSVKRNGVESDVQALEPGDGVTLTRDKQSGQPIAIQATAGQVVDISRYYLPLGLLLIVVVGLLMYWVITKNKAPIKANSAER